MRFYFLSCSGSIASYVNIYKTEHCWINEAKDVCEHALTSSLALAVSFLNVNLYKTEYCLQNETEDVCERALTASRLRKN